MKMGPHDSYLCLIPKPLDNVPAVQEQDSDADVTPARSWSLLQPLSGPCLYVCPHLSSEYRFPRLILISSLTLYSTTRAGSLTLTATMMKSDSSKRWSLHNPAFQVASPSPWVINAVSFSPTLFYYTSSLISFFLSAFFFHFARYFPISKPFACTSSK